MGNLDFANDLQDWMRRLLEARNVKVVSVLQRAGLSDNYFYSKTSKGGHVNSLHKVVCVLETVSPLTQEEKDRFWTFMLRSERPQSSGRDQVPP